MVVGEINDCGEVGIDQHRGAAILKSPFSEVLEPVFGTLDAVEPTTGIVGMRNGRTLRPTDDGEIPADDHRAKERRSVPTTPLAAPTTAAPPPWPSRRRGRGPLPRARRRQIHLSQD